MNYNSTSSTVSYIQEILHHEAVPQCLTISPGLQKELAEKGLDESDGVKQLVRVCGQMIYGRRDLKDLVDYWTFGEHILNITSTYKSKENYYSTDLHERLGDYLRAYRDYYNIDVMSFYNCYSNRLLSNVGLPITSAESGSSVSDDFRRRSTWWKGPPRLNTKVTCFPIKIGAKYTIAINNRSYGPVRIQPMFFHNGYFLNVPRPGDEKQLLRTNAEFSSFPYIVYKASLENLISAYDEESLKDVILAPDYDRASTIKLLKNQKYLCLVVEVPTTDSLNLSVVESSLAADSQVPYPAVNNTLLTEKLDKPIPFSDRLLEYLTGHVISPATPSSPCVAQIQRIVSSDSFYAKFGKRYQLEGDSKKDPKEGIGIFTENLRQFISSTLTHNQAKLNYKLQDFLGYVDKDVEELLWNCLTDEDKRLVLEGN